MLLRLIYGLIFGLLTIQRMDVPTVAYYLEGMDAGYGAYVGFMVVDKTHTHPIALSFINLLKALAKDNTKIPNTPGKANWHLLYTLLKNDELRHYRKHSIKMQKLEKKVRREEQRPSLIQRMKQYVDRKQSVEDEEKYIKPVEFNTTQLDKID